MDRDPVQVRLAGRGGQGVMLAGVVLADAAMRAGLRVVQTQSYGPEARLGAAKCDVILSRHEIAYPLVQRPDLLLCLSLEAHRKYGQRLAPGGMRVVDTRMLPEIDGADVLALPFLDTAAELGNPITANVVALGALVAVSEVVPADPLRRALAARIKPEALAANQAALDAGLRLGVLARAETAPSVGGPGAR